MKKKKRIYKKRTIEIDINTLELVNQLREETDETIKKVVNNRLILGLKELLKN